MQKYINTNKNQIINKSILNTVLKPKIFPYNTKIESKIKTYCKSTQMQKQIQNHKHKIIIIITKLD